MKHRERRNTAHIDETTRFTCRNMCHFFPTSSIWNLRAMNLLSIVIKMANPQKKTQLTLCRPPKHETRALVNWRILDNSQLLGLTTIILQWRRECKELLISTPVWEEWKYYRTMLRRWKWKGLQNVKGKV